MLGFLKSLFGGSSEIRTPPLPPPRFDTTALAQRLGVKVEDLQNVEIQYKVHALRKRSGGTRTIEAPSEPLKAMQRRILRRVLDKLRVHPHATGFQPGHSIVTNALPHVGKDVVIRLDLIDFFGTTKATRIERYFRFIGYDETAAKRLTHLCTWNNALPQGAPTSPRLSNLVNYKLDARLAGLASKRGLSYSRYADDITFSGRLADLASIQRQNPRTLERQLLKTPRLNDMISHTKHILQEEGYRLHVHRKLRIARRHQRQIVTGLVVNDRLNLPRETRRRLRAIEHYIRTGRRATLTPEQLDGWNALRHMIAVQSNPSA